MKKMSFDPIENMVQSLALYCNRMQMLTLETTDVVREDMEIHGVSPEDARRFADGVLDVLDRYPEHGWNNAVVFTLARYPFVVLQRWRGDRSADTRVPVEKKPAAERVEEVDVYDATLPRRAGEYGGIHDDPENDAEGPEEADDEAEGQDDDDAEGHDEEGNEEDQEDERDAAARKERQKLARETEMERRRGLFPGVHSVLLEELPSPDDVTLVAVDMNTWLPMHMTDLGAFYRASCRATTFALMSRVGHYAAPNHLVTMIGALGVCPHVTAFESRLPLAPAHGASVAVLGRLLGLVFPGLRKITTAVFLGDLSGSAVTDITLLGDIAPRFVCPRGLRALGMDSADPLASIAAMPPALARFVNNRPVKNLDALLDALPPSLETLELRLDAGQAAVLFRRLVAFPELRCLVIRMVRRVSDADLQAFADHPPLALTRFSWALFCRHADPLHRVIAAVAAGPIFHHMLEFTVSAGTVRHPGDPFGRHDADSEDPEPEDFGGEELDLDVCRAALERLPALRFLDGHTFGLCPSIWDCIPEHPSIDTVVHPDAFLRLEWSIVESYTPTRIKHVVTPFFEDEHPPLGPVAMWMFLCLSHHEDTTTELIK